MNASRVLGPGRSLGDPRMSSPYRRCEGAESSLLHAPVSKLASNTLRFYTLTNLDSLVGTGRLYWRYGRGQEHWHRSGDHQ
jgi:hypothetical protein